MNKKIRTLGCLMLVAVLVISLLPAVELPARAADAQTNTIGADEILTMCNPIGRLVKQNDAVRMESSASNFTLTGQLEGDIVLDVTVEEFTDEYHNLFAEIDGQMYYFELEAGRQSVTIARDLPAGRHAVQISKGPEAKKEVYYIHSVQYTGALEKTAAAAHRIEFLGDSITAGTGVYFYDAGFGGTHSYFTYANMTADALGADYYSVANGGWKFSQSLAPNDSIGAIYEKVSMHDASLGVYDFSWQPEVVVINLGTNDAIAGRKNTAYTEETYMADAATLLDKVRKNNPDAEIFWVYAMMLTERRTWIENAVTAYAANDSKVHYLELKGNMAGRGDHPDLDGHITAAQMLIEAISEQMGWEIDPAKDPVAMRNKEKIATAARIQKEAAQLDFTENYCPACGQIDGWTKLGGDTRSYPGTTVGSAPHFSGNQHFYWDAADYPDGVVNSTVYNWLQVNGSVNVCLHLSGLSHNYTGRIHWGGSGTLNIMGEGSLNAAGRSNATTNMGNLYINAAGTINLYGGTYTSGNTVTLTKPTKLTDGRYATLSVHNNAATVNIYEGVVMDSAGTNVAADIGTVNLYGGTLRGGKGYPYHADTISSDTTDWETCGGNVYLYGQSASAQAVFNMYGGTVTGGTAARGGNVFAYKNAQFNLYGGEIQNGTANAGKNLYVSDGATLKVGGDWSGSASVAFETGYAYGEAIQNGVSTGAFAGQLLYEAVADAYVLGENGKLVIGEADRYTAARIQREAATLDFSGNYCPACGQIDGWTKLGGSARAFPGTTIGNAPHFSGNQHFYWDASDYPTGVVNSTVYNWLQVNGSVNVCLHLSGLTHNYTGRIHWGGNGTLNIMGEGSLNAAGRSNATTNMGNLYINSAGTINLYGGTYTSDDTVTLTKPTKLTDGRYATLSVHNAGATVNIYDGVAMETTFGTNIAVDVGTVNMYGGTLRGGKGYPYHADTVTETTTDWEVCGGNVYLYGQGSTKQAVFNLYGGTVIGGTAARGGNVFAYKNAQFNLYGGDISDGTAQNGSDLYVSDAAALKVGGNWNGSATVAFGTAYACGDTIQNGTAGGDFAGKLLYEAEGQPNIYGLDGKLVISPVALCLADGSRSWQKDTAAAVEAHLENSGSYLFAAASDLTFRLPEGEQAYIDFNGMAATVAGSGKLFGMDSKNDAYALTDGKVTAAETVSVERDVTNPVTGKRYIALTAEGVTTFHALDLRLTAVTLRTDAAGVYYKAQLACDAVLKQQIAAYGVGVSLDGAMSPEKVVYTRQSGAPAQSFTSGSVFNIFRSSLSGASNAARGEMDIYAMPYLELADGTVLTAGVEARSLRDVVSYLNANFTSLDEETQTAAKTFYRRWAAAMAGWGLTNLQEN